MPAKTPQKAYFIGIGGIGMSALARWFKSQGYEIEGSDISKSSTTRELEAEGVKVHIGKHKPTNVPEDASRVIFNQAISENNPELVRARALNIPASSYPQSLGELTKLYKTIAIAGAHGKSTTTSLVSLILQKAKLDPTVIVGTKLKEFGGKNFRKGGSEYLVIEADEWKASFLNYLPYAALVTNIDREHLDYYKNFRNIKKTFEKFLGKVHPYGLIVLNKDDKNLAVLGKKLKRPVVWYSLNSKEAEIIKKIIKVPGAHNLSNATGAFALARALGIKRATIVKTIAEYNGVWRRSEYRGKYLGADVYDDYGHHPTEIKATLQGFKEKFSGARLVCVFQPHQRERLKLLFKEFTGAFDNSDSLVLLKIYAVAGRDDRKNKATSEKLAEAVSKKTGRVVPVVKNLKELKLSLKELISPSQKTVIIMMGAGNIVEYTDKLIDN